MTHPEILMTEMYGSRSERDASKIGSCAYCEAWIFDASGDTVISQDGLFCDMNCCCEYYEIRKRY